MGVVLIRAARAEDFLQVAALDRKAWPQDNLNSGYIPDGEHVWRHWVEDCLCRVAVLESGEVIGAALAFPTLDPKVYWLHKIFVDSNYQRQGIGSRLMAAVLEYIDAIGASIRLTVSPAKTHAIRLYESLGFTQATYYPGYYRASEHRWVMVRKSSSHPSE